MSERIVEIKNLRGGYKPGVDILNGIDLAIQAGEILGVIGLNGSGKSTLGKALVNLLPFQSGTVQFRGEDISHIGTDKLVKRGLKMMMQGGRVFGNLSVWQNLELAAQKELPHVIEQHKEEIPLLDKPAKELKSITADKLSGGQRLQLALAMTIAGNPRCIILDEPSAGLAPNSVDKMYELLHDIHQASGVTIILIEQNIAKAITFADRCILLNQGKITREFSSGDIKEVEKEMFNL